MEYSDFQMPSPRCLFIDAHCHLADARFANSQLDQVIHRSKSQKIEGWVQGSASPLDWDLQLALQKRFGKGIITAFGLHPWWVASATERELEIELQNLENRIMDAQALGELGLDGRKNPHTLEIQKSAFISQLRIAKASGKPMILHIVGSHSDAIKELQKQAPFPKSGIVHSFSGSYEVARDYLALGFLISIGGAITKKGFKTLKSAISQLPPEKIVIETDAPDQTPCLPGISVSSLNEPANLIGIAQVIAGLANLEYEELLISSANNLERLFGVNL